MQGSYSLRDAWKSTPRSTRGQGDSRIDSRATHHSPYLVTIITGTGEAFEIDSIHALGASISVSRNVKCVTCRCGGQDTGFGSGYGLVGSNDEIDTGDYGAVAVSRLYSGNSGMKTIDRR